MKIECVKTKTSTNSFESDSYQEKDRLTFGLTTCWSDGDVHGDFVPGVSVVSSKPWLLHFGSCTSVYWVLFVHSALILQIYCIFIDFEFIAFFISCILLRLMRSVRLYVKIIDIFGPP